LEKRPDSYRDFCTVQRMEGLGKQGNLKPKIKPAKTENVNGDSL